MANRVSTFSAASLAPRSTGMSSSQVSTTTLLNSLHAAYGAGQPYALDAATSLVVNTWLQSPDAGNAAPTVDEELVWRVWEHARRRAEDGCIVLGSLHPSTPSTLTPIVTALPVAAPPSLYSALSVLKAFTCHATPLNPSFARHSALAVNFTLNLTGELRGASVALSKSGINTQLALLQIPEEQGYRAFDVFYYLLSAASTPAEREFLGLKHPSVYALLNRSGTYDPPHYLPATDDAAAAEDFRTALKELGVKGAAHRNLLSILAGLLKLGDTLGLLIDAEDLDEVCDDVGGLLGLDPEVVARKCSTDDRTVLAAALYECLVDWILRQANDAIENEVQSTRAERSSRLSGLQTTDSDSEDGEDVVSITVVEIPRQDLGKAVALRGVFDDTLGINSEMKDDGVPIEPAGSSVLRETESAVHEVACDLGVALGSATRDHERELDRREAVLERIGHEAEPGSFLRDLVFPISSEGVLLGKHGRFDLADTVLSSRMWYHLSLHPTDDHPETLVQNAWSAGAVSRQLRSWRLPEWANRRNRNIDYTADFDVDEFASRYASLGCQDGRDGVENWIMERGWSNGDAVLGHERVWIHESAWWEAETMIDMKTEPEQPADPFAGASPYGAHANESGLFRPIAEEDPFASHEHLLSHHQSYAGGLNTGFAGAKSIAPTMARTVNTMPGDYGLGAKGDNRYHYDQEYDGPLDPELGNPKHVTTESMTFGRRAWVAFVWGVTFWIPSFLLRYVGRMKRPDVRMAWREKVVLVLLIFLLNGIVVFYIVEFGNLLCPNSDKAWNTQEVSEHQGDNDFYVSIHGKVYDISNFWQVPHSNVQGAITNSATMEPYAGQNLDALFPPPLYMACPHLVTDQTIKLETNSSVISNSAAVHWSGANAQFPQSSLRADNWYTHTFIPKITQYYKGDLVWDPGNVTADGKQNRHMWIMLNNNIYDFTDYFYTQQLRNPVGNLPHLAFLPTDVVALIQGNPGQDVTSQWGTSPNFTNALECMNNVFYKGITDFRESPRCQVNNYILLAFTIILCLVILVKFVSALQFGAKRRPAPQDKFVICQVPAYTEGEDQLRQGLDSLTALEYDNKRKLICVICDGMIVGGGNDRPTPKIVLDILGVDPKLDPPALPFKSVGQGSEQLNYGKVYSGLYEYEGNVVPYIVVVKVGKESEQTKSKPGNRGKRDSQIMLMSFLNRVHHRAPMNPLELEMFHQINNIIGVDPELYEYLFMVDADTSVREDSLNRLVANCASDAKIAGICGETSLQNEGKSWWTMIQVYEYYISHHLAKAFESLFGSVTCLPGCFCMYRLRTADKGRPLIISDKIIAEYSDGNVDTLHKKNLFSLGEDRYLTTLMTKHFPQMSYKFVADAYAATAAPESWGVLLSQRRRWINSTIHNLTELVFLKDLCGFCCFSMRFVVFIDLFGTLILPATCAYLGYLIYRVATHTGQFPLISIVMLAAVYGLQALIFLLRRQWQHIGWMIIYIIAFPVYSLILPIYSFWKQDDFSWGTTRIVIGEKGARQVVAMEDEGFDPRSIPLQRWNDYVIQHNLPGRRGYGEGDDEGLEKPAYDPALQYTEAYEMDDLRTVYSDARPASTVLTGFPGLHGGAAGAAFLPPVSPAYPPGQLPRHATAPSLSGPMSAGPTVTAFRDAPQYGRARPPHVRVQSTPAWEAYRDDAPASPAFGASVMHRASTSQHDLRASAATPPARFSRSPLGMPATSPARLAPSPRATVDFRGVDMGPDAAQITAAVRACLAEVDLERVTKKQVRAMVEQRLGVEMVGERRTTVDAAIDSELANM